MQRLLWVLVSGAILTQTAMAEAILKVRSDMPARAFLNGQLLGATPLTVTKLKAGTYTIKIENNATGELKMFNVYSPKQATVEKEILAEFADNPLPPPPLPPTREAVRTTVVQRRPIVRPPPPPQVVTVYEEVPPPPVRVRRAPAYGPYNDDYYYREERQKVRSRNVLLGAAAANELLNQGNSKGTVRAVTLGGALLNEVLRQGQ